MFLIIIISDVTNNDLTYSLIPNIWPNTFLFNHLIVKHNKTVANKIVKY